jgi:copper chaperone CopZ
MKNLILLTLLMSVFTACNNHANKDESNHADVIKKVEITVTGMSCTGCEETITESVQALKGVKEATASYTDGKAWISYKEGSVTTEQISAAIEKTGYKVTGVSPVEQNQ